MNGFTFGWQILPDQMQVANPILILLCIPLFNKVIYPMLGQTSQHVTWVYNIYYLSAIWSGKCGILTTPLQRIVTGCLICGLSFVVSGILELELKKVRTNHSAASGHVT